MNQKMYTQKITKIQQIQRNNAKFRLTNTTKDCCNRSHINIGQKSIEAMTDQVGKDLQFKMQNKYIIEINKHESNVDDIEGIVPD